MTEVQHPQPASRLMPSNHGVGQSSTRRIGMVICNFDSPYYGQVVDGASDLLRQNGYTALVHSSGTSSAGERMSWDALMRSRCDGIICYTRSTPKPQLLEMLQEHPHWVSLNRCLPGFERRCVYLDNARGTRLAAQHLVNNGHTKVAMITGPAQFPEVAERTRGFVDELACNGLTLEADLIVDGEFTFEGGKRAFRRLLQTDRPFTALFCHNDESAAGVIDICRLEGISVPAELSIVGFDDTKIASITSPRLTTIMQPIGGSGAHAAEIMMSLLVNGDDQLGLSDDYGKLIPQLVIRDSVSDLRSRSVTLGNQLTPRETECTQWIAAGKTSSEIAIILSISENTVNFHLKNVILKLNASNRTHAVALALSKDLIERL